MKAMATHSKRSRLTEIGEESRQRILDAAETLFLEKGFEKTTLADVGRLSGISYGSIPWHFENKKGLLLAVSQRYWDAPELDDMPHNEQGLDLIMAQMEKWDTNPVASLFANVGFDESDLESQYFLRARDLDERRHAAIAEWISKTLAGRDLPDGLTPISVAYFWTAASRGVFFQKYYIRNFSSDALPRKVLRHTLLSILGLET